MTEEHNQSDSSLALTNNWGTGAPGADTGDHWPGPGILVTVLPPPSHAHFRLELVKFIITTFVLIKVVLNILCTSSQYRKSLKLNCFWVKFDHHISLSSLDLTAVPGLLLRVDPEWDKIIENVRFCAGGSRLMLGLELNLKHLSLSAPDLSE